MSKKEKTSQEIEEVKVEKKDKHTIRYVIIFVIFFVIGIVCGYIGASKFLDLTEEEKEPAITDVDEILDITEEEEYSELISSLLVTLDNDPMFYSTKGLSVDTMENSFKLKLLYNHIINNNLGESLELTSDYYGSTTCVNGFVTDVGENALVSTNKCTVKKIDKSVFVETNKKLFNDEILDVSVNFSPKSDVQCVVNGESYLCGTVLNELQITGNLESVFSIVKVTKDTDSTIVIYEKGYLNDKRSNVNDPYDQYDNYYLHSSDSEDYYYELKSADNLTFKHTFKTTDRQNYYYVSTELVKE